MEPPFWVRKNDLTQISTGIRYNETDETIEIEINGVWTVWKSGVGAHSWDAFTNDTTWNISGDSTWSYENNTLVFRTNTGGHFINAAAITAGKTLHVHGILTNNNGSSVTYWNLISTSASSITSESYLQVGSLANGASIEISIDMACPKTGYFGIGSSADKGGLTFVYTELYAE